jgi:ABC-2 type transport system ATP-binding protein
MIEVRNLSKFYGDFHAVRGISFDVKKGEVVGFLGPNGAGKSTTLRILVGFLGATSGEARVNGHSVTEEPLRARESIGYMPEMAPLYPEMRVREYLTFRAELKGVKRKERVDAVARAVKDAGLDGRESTLIRELSKGYRQRVGLADALVASPPLLILDEPTAGLDPNQIREVRALIGRLANREQTILVSTHILSEVEAMCSRAVVIARGKLVAEGTLDELRGARTTDVRIRVRGELEEATKLLRTTVGVAAATVDGGAVVVKFGEGAAPDDVVEAAIRALVGAEIGVLEISSTQRSLEQIFSELTADDRGPGAKQRRGRA